MNSSATTSSTFRNFFTVPSDLRSLTDFANDNRELTRELREQLPAFAVTSSKIATVASELSDLSPDIRDTLSCAREFLSSAKDTMSATRRATEKATDLIPSSLDEAVRATKEGFIAALNPGSISATRAFDHSVHVLASLVCMSQAGSWPEFFRLFCTLCTGLGVSETSIRLYGVLHTFLTHPPSEEGAIPHAGPDSTTLPPGSKAFFQVDEETVSEAAYSWFSAMLPFGSRVSVYKQANRSRALHSNFMFIKDLADLPRLLIKTIQDFLEIYNVHVLGQTDEKKYEEVIAPLRTIYAQTRGLSSRAAELPSEEALAAFTALSNEFTSWHSRYAGSAILHRLERTITEVQSLLGEHQAFLERRAKYDRSRPRPALVVVRGGAQIGKTTFSRILCAATAALIGMPDFNPNRDVHHPVKGTDYPADAYNGQPFWIDDDLFMNLEPVTLTTEAAKLADAVNTIKYPLNAARLEDKGVVFFRSRAVVASTNMLNGSEIDPNTKPLRKGTYLTNPDIIDERIDIEIIFGKPENWSRAEFEKPDGLRPIICYRDKLHPHVWYDTTFEAAPTTIAPLLAEYIMKYENAVAKHEKSYQDAFQAALALKGKPHVGNVRPTPAWVTTSTRAVNTVGLEVATEMTDANAATVGVSFTPATLRALHQDSFDVFHDASETLEPHAHGSEDDFHIPYVVDDVLPPPPPDSPSSSGSAGPFHRDLTQGPFHSAWCRTPSEKIYAAIANAMVHMVPMSNFMSAFRFLERIHNDDVVESTTPGVLHFISNAERLEKLASELSPYNPNISLYYQEVRQVLDACKQKPEPIPLSFFTRWCFYCRPTSMVALHFAFMSVLPGADFDYRRVILLADKQQGFVDPTTVEEFCIQNPKASYLYKAIASTPALEKRSPVSSWISSLAAKMPTIPSWSNLPECHWDEKTKKILLSAAGIVSVVTVGILMWSLFGRSKREEHANWSSSEPVRHAPKKTERRAPLAAKFVTGKSKLVEMVSNLSPIYELHNSNLEPHDADAVHRAPVVRQYVGRLVMVLENGTRSVNMFAIGGKLFLSVKHMWNDYFHLASKVKFDFSKTDRKAVYEFTRDQIALARPDEDFAVDTSALVYVWPLQDQDLCAIYAPKILPFSEKVVKQFAKIDEVFDSNTAFYVTERQGETWVISMTNLRVNVGGKTTYGKSSITRSIRSRAACMRGDCTAPIMICNPAAQGKIAGFHVGGEEASLDAVGILITQEDILAIREALDPLIPHSGIELTKDQLPGVTAIESAPYRTPRMPDNSNIIPSMIAPILNEEPAKVRSKLRPFTNDKGERVSPAALAFIRMSQCSSNQEFADRSILQEIEETLYQYLPALSAHDAARILTEAEIINGIPGLVPALDKKTGRGFPWSTLLSGRGKDPFLEPDPDHPGWSRLQSWAREKVDELEKAILEIFRTEYQEYGTMYGEGDFRHFYEVYLKDELLKPGKDTRSILCDEFFMLYLCKKYFGFQMARLQQHASSNDSFSAIGINPHSSNRWTELAESVGLDPEARQMIELDVQNNDGTKKACVTHVQIETVLKWLGGDEDPFATIRRALLYRTYDRWVVMLGKAYKFEGGTPTGAWNTAFGNTIDLAVQLCYAYLKHARTAFSHKRYTLHDAYEDFLCFMKGLGDDTLANVHKRNTWFNQQVIAKILKEDLGVVVTDATKSETLASYADPSSVTFLKRGFLFDPETGRYRAPLDKKSIQCMYLWNSVGGNPDENTRYGVLCALYEYAHYGKKEFEIQKRRLNEALIQVKLKPVELNYSDWHERWLNDSIMEHTPASHFHPAPTDDELILSEHAGDLEAPDVASTHVYSDLLPFRVTFEYPAQTFPVLDAHLDVTPHADPYDVTVPSDGRNIFVKSIQYEARGEVHNALLSFALKSDFDVIYTAPGELIRVFQNSVTVFTEIEDFWDCGCHRPEYGFLQRCPLVYSDPDPDVPLHAFSIHPTTPVVIPSWGGEGPTNREMHTIQGNRFAEGLWTAEGRWTGAKTGGASVPRRLGPPNLSLRAATTLLENPITLSVAVSYNILFLISWYRMSTFDAIVFTLSFIVLSVGVPFLILLAASTCYTWYQSKNYKSSGGQSGPLPADAIRLSDLLAQTPQPQPHSSRPSDKYMTLNAEQRERVDRIMSDCGLPPTYTEHAGEKGSPHEAIDSSAPVVETQELTMESEVFVKWSKEKVPVPVDVPILDPLHHRTDESASRAYQIGSCSPNTSTGLGANLLTINLTTALFANQKLADVASRWTFFRCDGIEVTFKVSATPTFLGFLIAYFCPNCTSVTGDPSYIVSPWSSAFSDDRTIFGVNKSPSVKMLCPWRLPIPAGELGGSANTLGMLVLDYATALANVSPTPTTAINVTVYARFVNPQFYGPTTAVLVTPTLMAGKKPTRLDPMDELLWGRARNLKEHAGEEDKTSKKIYATSMALTLTGLMFSMAGIIVAAGGVIRQLAKKRTEPDPFAAPEEHAGDGPEEQMAAEAAAKSESTKPSGILGAISSAAGALSFVPIVGPFAKVASVLFGIGSAAARAFGHENPNVVNQTQYVQQHSQRGAANVDAGVASDNLGLTSTSRTSNDPSSVLDSRDNMFIFNFLSAYSLLDSFTIASNTAVDVVTKAYWVGPSYVYGSWSGVSAPYTMVGYPTRLSHFARWAEWWRGSLKYRLRIGSSELIRFRIRIVIIPTYSTISATFPSTFSSAEGDVLSYLIDVSGEKEFEFVVPFMQARQLLPTGYPSAISNAGTTTSSPNFASAQILIVLDTAITTPSTTTFNIPCMLEVCAGNDFVFCRPRSDILGVQTFGMSPLREHAGADNEVDDPESIRATRGGITFGLYTPEPILNFRDLINRFHFFITPTWTAISGGYAANWNNTAIGSASALGSILTCFRYERGSIYYRIYNNTAAAVALVAAVLPPSIYSTYASLYDIHLQSVNGGQSRGIPVGEAMTFHAPQYSPYLARATNTNASLKATQEKIVLWCTSNPAVRVFIAAGDDYCFGVPCYPGSYNFSASQTIVVA